MCCPSVRPHAVPAEFAAAAARIQALWESGRVCPHTGSIPFTRSTLSLSENSDLVDPLMPRPGVAETVIPR